jgi:DNA repair protein RadC
MKLEFTININLKSIIMKSLKVKEITVSYSPVRSKKKVINTSNDAYNVLVQFFPENTIELQEQFVVLYLNRANKVTGGYKVSIGGISSTIVDVRLILSVALKTLATGIIIAHNHPSGNTKPSIADQELTKRIKEASDFMDISLLDHLIITNEAYLSFADEGIL